MKDAGFWIGTRYRDAIVFASALAFGASGCWHEMPQPSRDAFVADLLESIRDDTRFHRDYVLSRDSTTLGELRPLLAKPYAIVRWAGPLLDDECYVDMADGSRLLLHVIQRRRAVEKVALYYYPAPGAASS